MDTIPSASRRYKTLELPFLSSERDRAVYGYPIKIILAQMGKDLAHSPSHDLRARKARQPLEGGVNV
jgi:hypothetical protein